MKIDINNFLKDSHENVQIIYMLNAKSTIEKTFVNMHELIKQLGSNFSHSIFLVNKKIKDSSNGELGGIAETFPGFSIEHYDREREVAILCTFTLNGSLELICNSDDYANEFLKFFCPPYENIKTVWKCKGEWIYHKEIISKYINAIYRTVQYATLLPENINSMFKQACQSFERKNFYQAFCDAKRVIESILAFEGKNKKNGSLLSDFMNLGELQKDENIPSWIFKSLESISNFSNINCSDFSKFNCTSQMASFTVSTASWFIGKFYNKKNFNLKLDNDWYSFKTYKEVNINEKDSGGNNNQVDIFKNEVTEDRNDILLHELSFVEKFKYMTEEKQIFLYFLFIAKSLKYSFFKLEFELVSKEFSIPKINDFDQIIDFFSKENIINIKNSISLRHSSYAEVIDYLLSNENALATPVNIEILSRILIRLSTECFSYRNVAIFLLKYLDRLPKDIWPLLIELSKKKNLTGIVADTICKHFKILPKSIKNMIFDLAKKDPNLTALAIAEHFNHLPGGIQNLLFTLAHDSDNSFSVFLAIADNYEKLPKQVKELLFEITDSDSGMGPIAFGLKLIFDELPQNVADELMFKLIQKEEIASVYFMEQLCKKRENISEEVKAWLLDIAERDKQRFANIFLISDKVIETFPNDIKKELLFRFISV